MAVVGVPVAGVGTAPGAIIATAGKLTSTTGLILEVGVELIAGSEKNAAITAGNEVVHEVVERIGSKAVDKISGSCARSSKRNSKCNETPYEYHIRNGEKRKRITLWKG